MSVLSSIPPFPRPFSTCCVESLHDTVGILTPTAVGVGWQMMATFWSRALTPLAWEHYGVVCIRQNTPTSSAVNKLIFRTVQALLADIFSVGPWLLLKHELKFISWAVSVHSLRKSKKFTNAKSLIRSAEPPNISWKVAFLFNSLRTFCVVNVLLED